MLDPIIYLEETRPEEQIEGTGKDGTAVFRKILRRLFFHDWIRDIETNDLNYMESEKIFKNIVTCKKGVVEYG